MMEMRHPELVSGPHRTG